MDYRLVRRKKKKSIAGIVIAIVAILFVLFLAGKLISALSPSGQKAGKAMWIAGTGIGTRLQNMTSFFASKRALMRENEELLSQLREKDALLVDRHVLRQENEELKAFFGREDASAYTLARVLVKPNRSLYDTIIIDTDAVTVGQLVYAYGHIPIGKVAEVYSGTAKIILFSSPGEVLAGELGENSIAIELRGKGAGNFEVRLPRDIVVPEGSEIVLPFISPQVIAVVQESISDPRDPFQKILAKSPVNVFQLKWVEIRR